MIINHEDDHKFSSDTGLESPVYPPHIEPIFWGTSDLLIWNTAQIMKNVDGRSVYNSIVKDRVIEGVPSEDYETHFMPIFNKIYGRIVDFSLIDSRGIYGYFPIITEKGGIVVLDPSDFHSELLQFTVLTDTTSNASLVKELNPEGDIIAFAAVMRRNSIIEYFIDSGGDLATEAIEKEIIQYIDYSVTLFLEKKITAEIRKGLGIDELCGKFIHTVDIALPPPTLKRLFEIMGYEERLGIMTDTMGKILPEQSLTGIYFHTV